MEDIAIQVVNVSKVYKLYNRPIDRLKEALNPFGKKYHKEHYALKDISFKIRKGEIVGIIGANGSGKSTILKIITGVLTPTSGNVIIDGRVSALLELGAGFNPEYTGIENIYLNGTMMGYTKEEMDIRASKIIEFADIGEFMYQPVKTYSSGMFSRLAFAVSINVDPDILIVDEALSVGDYRFQAKCYKKIEELGNNGKTILMVTHDIDSVRKFCNRAIWIDKGYKVDDGSVEKVTSNYLESLNVDKEQDNNIYLSTNDNDREKVSDFNPIARWGEKTGLIKYVSLNKGSQNGVSYINFMDKISVEIVVDIIDDIDIEGLGVAISIKNTKGQDIIVSSTFDNNLSFSKSGKYRIVFIMENYLVPGEYYLVASLEHRRELVPYYIDYIDGAYYFKVLSNKTHYGMLNIPTNVIINRL